MYKEFKEQQQKEMNDFSNKYIFFAFNENQLKEGLEKLNVKENEKEKLCYIGVGGYIKKEDKNKYIELLKRNRTEFKKKIEEDQTGNNFIFEMFYYEMWNHEYCITCDLEDTIESLGLTYEEIENNEALLKGLKKAKEKVIKEYNESN